MQSNCEKSILLSPLVGTYGAIIYEGIKGDMHLDIPQLLIDMIDEVTEDMINKDKFMSKEDMIDVMHMAMVCIVQEDMEVIDMEQKDIIEKENYKRDLYVVEEYV